MTTPKVCKTKKQDITYIAETLPRLGANAPALGIVSADASPNEIREALLPLNRRCVKKLSIKVEVAEDATMH